MIVYGDPHYDVPLASMLEGLRSTLRTAIDRADGSLATARFLLIFAGQLEQAAFDAAPLAKSSELLETIHGATRYLGRAFYSAWAHHGWSNVLPSFTSAYSLLSDVDCKLEVVLTVKLPEGYSFYALYPEQYCNAALRWIKDHEQAAVRIAAVVGIRSIGTSAAAAVTATLEASGWHVGSFTVRPQGDPFNRETLLDPLDINSSALCIIVDEGPGISGSSMASVGDALFREGIQPGQISFMPGSSSEPGSAASDYVREWWRRTPRYPASFPDRPQSGAHPPGIAEGSINSLVEPGDRFVQWEEVGGGLWRSRVYRTPDQWPAVCAPFERPKYLCTTERGHRVLLKFEGLATIQLHDGTFVSTAEAAAGIMRAHAGRGLCREPVGVLDGYLVLPWVEGAPLVRSDACDALVQHLGRYISEVAGPPVSTGEQNKRLQALIEILYWNLWEALGESTAARVRDWANTTVNENGHLPTLMYGDGHLAPHEWVRTPAGDLVKVDCAGHGWDHTTVGAQTVLWDLAGACVEWCLDQRQIHLLVESYMAAGGEIFPPDMLNLYRAGYAAFRAGQCHMCAGMLPEGDPERTRLIEAYEQYISEVLKASSLVDIIDSNGAATLAALAT